MGSFRVVRRNGRDTEIDLYKALNHLLSDPECIYYNSYGLPDGVENIMNVFLMVENAYHKAFSARYIGFEICIAFDNPLAAYQLLDDLIMQIGSAYYILGTVKNIDEGLYQLTLLVQMTSYTNGERFTDNNSVLVQLMEWISKKTNQELVALNGTFFTPYTSNQSCYI